MFLKHLSSGLTIHPNSLESTCAYVTMEEATEAPQTLVHTWLTSKGQRQVQSSLEMTKNIKFTGINKKRLLHLQQYQATRHYAVEFSNLHLAQSIKSPSTKANKTRNLYRSGKKLTKTSV